MSMRRSSLHSAWALALALTVGACAPRPRVTLEGNCEELGTPLSQTSWAGPSEESVLATTGAFVPTEVVWDAERTRADPGAPPSAIAVVATRTGEEATVVTRACLSGPEAGPFLRLAMSFALDIDDGGVTGVVPGAVYAGLTDPAVLVGMDGVGSLSSAWEALALDFTAKEFPLETVTSYRLNVTWFSEWTAAEVAVNWESQVGIGTLWLGTWTNAATPPGE